MLTHPLSQPTPLEAIIQPGASFSYKLHRQLLCRRTTIEDAVITNLGRSLLINFRQVGPTPIKAPITITIAHVEVCFVMQTLVLHTITRFVYAALAIPNSCAEL